MTYSFPQGFLWGRATAANQSEEGLMIKMVRA